MTRPETCLHCGHELVCPRCGATTDVAPLQWSDGARTLLCAPCLEGLQQVVRFYMDGQPTSHVQVPDYPPKDTR